MGLVGASQFVRPMFLLFTTMSLSLFCRTRGGRQTLALGGAALAIGGSLLRDS
jgi:hypothetical protein